MYLWVFCVTAFLSQRYQQNVYFACHSSESLPCLFGPPSTTIYHKLLRGIPLFANFRPSSARHTDCTAGTLLYNKITILLALLRTVAHLSFQNFFHGIRKPSLHLLSCTPTLDTLMNVSTTWHRDKNTRNSKKRQAIKSYCNWSGT